jgi:hypothetical protein
MARQNNYKDISLPHHFPLFKRVLSKRTNTLFYFSDPKGPKANKKNRANVFTQIEVCRDFF